MIEVWLPQLTKFNTLRNQMLFGFLLVMIIILTVVGIVTFDSVATLLKNKAEVHIQQTAIQANGRLEGILEQIDSLTTVVSTNPYVQNLLLNERNGMPASFSERQALQQVVNIVQIYAHGVKSVEIYSYERKRLYPLDEAKLEDRVSNERIDQATQEKGGIIWFGIDPLDRESVLAIRRISLMDNNFSSGGYLLVRINRDVFSFQDPLSGDGEQETTLLLGNDGQIIASNDHTISERDAALLVNSDNQSVDIGDKPYILVRQRSDVTEWTLLILTPLSAITKGISVLRTVIFVSAGIGTLLFILLSLLLSTMITRPVFKLIKTMRGARLGVLKPTDIVTSTIEINELNRTYNQMVGNINDLIRLVYEKEILQSRTELKALQAQINPHFLFNTLEALYWSLQEKEEDELAEFVVAMSDLFRYTIMGPNKDEWVTLSEELEHIERYLLIMKMRLGERLTWQITTSDEFAAVKLPKLLIQPFVENAIAHGIERKIGQGAITVSIKRSVNEEELRITIVDNGAGMDEVTLRTIVEGLENGQVPSVKKSGLGIDNVHRRVKLFYEEEAGMPGRISIRSREGKGTSICMTIPAVTGGNHESTNDNDR